MKPFSPFEKKSALGGTYLLLMVNRFQILFLFLIIPMYLIHPYMIWAIVAIGTLSQINMILLSKWFSSSTSGKGYQGFIELFGERMVRFFSFLGLFSIGINVTTIIPGYVEIVRHFIFPSMNADWLILFLFLMGCYMAGKGMENTIRFVVIAFLAVFWTLFLFIPFFLPPIASLSDLYPLIPSEWSSESWKRLLFIWSSFAGPEYLIFLGPWLKPQQNILKYLTIANAFSAVEYVILFVASLLFFGSQYLSISRFPVVNMLRYLQSPIFERIDIILITLHMFHIMFCAAMYILFFYGAARITLGKVRAQTTRTGFITSCATLFACTVMVNQYFWKSNQELNIWFTLQTWSLAVTYLLVPTILVIAMKRKGLA